MIIGFILLQLIFGSFDYNDKPMEYCYKSDEAYVLQEVVYSCDYTPITAGVRLKTEGGVFYLAKQKDIVKFIKEDSLDTKSLTIIVEPKKGWRLYKVQEEIKNYPSYTSGLEQLFTLDDTEIYRIGKKCYAFRKIKYMYCDEIDLYNTKYNFKYIGCERFDDAKEQDSIDKITYINFRDYYEGRGYRYFICLNQLLPTDKSISKHVWKRKYELPLFWYVESIILIPCEKPLEIKLNEN